MRLCKQAVFAALAGGVVGALALRSQTTARTPDARQFLDQYCVNCHPQKLRTAALELHRIDASKPGPNAEVWDRVIAKLRAGSMPPPRLPRPDAGTYRAVAGTLEGEIDRAWAARPEAGRANAVHRLNRAEYQN